MSPKSNRSVLIRDQKGHTDRRPHGDGGVVWRRAATAGEQPGSAGATEAGRLLL